MVSFLVFIFFIVLFFFYSYYNVMLLMLLFEFLNLFLYYLIVGSASYFLVSMLFLVIFSCYMVLEAILGLSCLLASYRFMGKRYFFLW